MKYRVKWYRLADHNISGQGDPMSKRAAEVWAKKANLEHPGLYHYVEEVNMVDLMNKTPKTDEEVMEYLATICQDEVQRGSAQCLYRVRRAQGDSIERAYATVLYNIVGQPIPNRVKEM